LAGILLIEMAELINIARQHCIGHSDAGSPLHLHSPPPPPSPLSTGSIASCCSARPVGDEERQSAAATVQQEEMLLGIMLSSACLIHKLVR
jgi:hypothetical protein